MNKEKIVPAFLTTHQLLLGLFVDPVVGSHGGADHHLPGVPCILCGEAGPETICVQIFLLCNSATVLLVRSDIRKGNIFCEKYDSKVQAVQFSDIM